MNVLGDECLGDDCRTIGQFGTGQFVCGAKLFWYHLKNSLSNDLKSLNVFFRKKCNPRLETVRHLILVNTKQHLEKLSEFQNVLNHAFEAQNIPISPRWPGLRPTMHSYKFPVGESFENNNSPIKYFVGFSSQSSQNY